LSVVDFAPGVEKLIERYVKAHLAWRAEQEPSAKERLLARSYAARGVLRGGAVQEAARRIDAAQLQAPKEETMTEEIETHSEEERPKVKAAKKAKKKPKKARARAEGSIIDSMQRQEYEKSNVKTPSGSRSVSCGDAVAKALNGLTLDQLEKLAKKADMADSWAKWKKLNPGMIRMNLGNRLRAQVKQGDVVAKNTVAEAAKMDREVVGKGQSRKAA
jgi:hypothetical protein